MHLKIRFKRVLDPIDRVPEVLGGVIMVLTFTNALSVSHAGEADVRGMLIGSLGCNFAWGIIESPHRPLYCCVRFKSKIRCTSSIPSLFW